MNRYYEDAEIAKNYVKFRPHYPKEIATSVLEFYILQNNNKGLPVKLDLMIDVGCGNGQASNLFQPFFNKIIGCDVSLEQLKLANEQNVFSNIEYVEASAEKLPADDNSVDIIVSGEAAHWFDLPKFFAECERVLKPSGCLAMFGYYFPNIITLKSSNKDLSMMATELFENILMRDVFYDPSQTKTFFMVKNRYREIFEKIPLNIKQMSGGFQISYDWSLNDCKGFMLSYDPFQSGMKRKIKELRKRKTIVSQVDIDDISPYEEFVKLLKKLWKMEDVNDNEKIMTAQYDFFLLVASKSKNFQPNNC